MRRPILARITPASAARVLTLTGALMLGGCYALPIDGPLLVDVQNESKPPHRLPFRLVQMAPDMVPVLQGDAPPADELIPDLGAQDPRVGPGDGLIVTVVEPGSGGLFSGPPALSPSGGETGARVVTLPEATVDAAGRIVVPFAGTLDVAGKTGNEIAAQIKGALTGQAVEPQVMVTLSHSAANRVTVDGAVKSPAVLAEQPNGETLLEAIARAGGPTEAPENLVVQLNRFGSMHRMRFQTLLDNPAANIHVRGGDLLHLLVQPRTFTLLGAADKIDQQRLPLGELSLAEALSRAGGLLDYRANAHGVMLFRYERPDTMDRIAAIEAKVARTQGETAPIPPTRPAGAAADGPPVPVVYVLNMRSATGLFVAHELTVHDHDLVYVPDADAVQWQKFLDLIRITANPVTSSAQSAKAF